MLNTSNDREQSTTMNIVPLAFSNPIYGIFQPDTFIEPSSSSSISNSTPVFLKGSSLQNSLPVPKPRKSKLKNLESELNVSRLSNLETVVDCEQSESSSPSSFDREQERMNELLNEINFLTDSLVKSNNSLLSETKKDSLFSQNSQQTKPTNNEKDDGVEVAEVQHRQTLGRRRLPIKSDLLKISFNSVCSTVFEESPNNSPKVFESDSGVFAIETSSSASDEPGSSQNQIKLKNEEETRVNYKPKAPVRKLEKVREPPKLPPRKPLRLDIAPKVAPVVKSFQEKLKIEHLHLDTLSLQRSGYLWKTGPNFKCFKNRWCVLYRHNQNYFDANISYYFNRSSMSASLCGKILLMDIEFIAVTETVPSKTRLPKVEKQTLSTTTTTKISDLSQNKSSIFNTTDDQTQTLSFFQIGVRSRQGRVYLFAARSNSDRQQWIHAFVQAITLHEFKNKDFVQCGFIKAKFTVTAKWQMCFALLTVDRFLYVFEFQPDRSVPTLDCQRYHLFDLRKTVRFCQLDEHSMMDDNNNLSGTVNLNTNTAECKYGFSLTQDGGHVLYLVANFVPHTTYWYRLVWQYWRTSKDSSDKWILEQQYLTKDNVPVAVDKCLKFLDTFNQNNLNLFGPMLDLDEVKQNPTNTVRDKQKNPLTTSNDALINLLFSSPSSYSSSTSSPTTVSKQFQRSNSSKTATTTTNKNIITNAATNENALNIDLLMHQQLLNLLRFDAWSVHLLPQKYNVYQISQVLLQYFWSMNECIFTEALLPYWIKLATAIVDSKQSNTELENPNKPNDQENPQKDVENLIREEMKRLLKMMPTVNYGTLRRLIIFLHSNSKMISRTPQETDETNEKYSLSNVVCKVLFFSKKNKPSLSVFMSQMLLSVMIAEHKWLFDVTKEEIEREAQIKRVVSLIRDRNLQKQHHQKLAKDSVTANFQQRLKMIRSHTSSDLLKKKTDPQKVNSLIISVRVIVSSENRQVIVNVHITSTTTANDIFEMIFEKVKFLKNEEILNKYSVFEVICNHRLERVILGKETILPIVLCWSSWPPHWSLEACIEVKPTERLLKKINVPLSENIKLPNLNVIRFKNDSLLSYTPTMLMSVVRYCDQNKTRLVKNILAEFSSSQLFLYCKETHHMLGQYALEDIYWYVGLESSSILQYSQIKCSAIVPENDNFENIVTVSTPSVLEKPGSNSSQGKRFNQTGSQQQPHIAITGQADFDVPALTFVERREILPKPNLDRQNFGQTLVFNTNAWNELNQWIKGLLEASVHRELFQ